MNIAGEIFIKRSVVFFKRTHRVYLTAERITRTMFFHHFFFLGARVFSILSAQHKTHQPVENCIARRANISFDTAVEWTMSYTIRARRYKSIETRVSACILQRQRETVLLFQCRHPLAPPHRSTCALDSFFSFLFCASHPRSRIASDIARSRMEVERAEVIFPRQRGDFSRPLFLRPLLPPFSFTSP